MQSRTERWWAALGFAGLATTTYFYFACGFSVGLQEACHRFENPVSRTDSLRLRPPSSVRQWWPHLPEDASHLIEQRGLDGNRAVIAFRLLPGTPCPWRDDLIRSASPPRRWTLGAWPTDLNERLRAANGPEYVPYELRLQSHTEYYAINCASGDVAGWAP
jgi:hypothetical protein